MREFLIRLKFVKFADLLAVFPMLIGLLLAPWIKLKHRQLWLLCERHHEARDNGYWFFKYLREQQPTIDAVYVIDADCADFHKIDALGQSIRWGTVEHWAYYFAATYNVSTQKNGNPRAALCFVLENYLRMNNHRIFLQHGITQNNVAWLNYNISNFKLFCCAVEPECDFVRKQLGYPDSVAQLTGFCRFDNLLSAHETKRQILVMPTWRNWLGRISSDTTKYEISTRFVDSEYYKSWSSFLNNGRLHDLLGKYDCDLVFYPHSNLQKYIHEFDVAEHSHIVVADSVRFDVQTLMMESAAMITDYSSVFFDFAYMNKPLAYYQFDYDKFRAGQYDEGYFSYHNNGFGPDVRSEDAILDWIEQMLKNNFANPEEYVNRVKDFFVFRDTKNCERTFNAIIHLENR